MGQEDGWWDEFRTCLIAPENYLKSITLTAKYDIEIAYEDIYSYLRNQQGHDERFNDHSYGDDSRVALLPCFSVLAAMRLTAWPGVCSAYP